MEGKPLYNFKYKAVCHVGRAYEVKELNEEEWGIPKIENKRSSIPVAFDLFPTFPAVNDNGTAITYLTAKRSIGTLPHQYLNKNHVMKGDYVTDDFQADRDTILGTMLAARLVNEPEELGVFIPQPAICQVLGVVWPLSEHGEKIIQKMRESIAKGEKEGIGASYELYFNDKGFIWRGKLYQENYLERAEDMETLRELENCLGYSNGTLYVASSYEGEKPTLLVGGADGFVLFHGAGIIEGSEEPAFPETKGQFNLLATRDIPAYIARAGLAKYAEQKNQEARVDEEKIKELLAAFGSEIKEAIASALNPEKGEPAKVDEKVVAAAVDKVLTAKKDELNKDFGEAVKAKVEEERPKIEKEVRDTLEAEAKAYQDMLDLCGKHNVEIKDEVGEKERAVAKKSLQDFAKEPESAITKLKAEIFGLPNDESPRRSSAAALPSGGGGNAEPSGFKTPEELEQEVDN